MAASATAERDELAAIGEVVELAEQIGRRV
jgi:hypothetical protein